MFKLIKKLESGVRIGELETAHGKIETPFFMPVGTQGSVKGISPDELEEIGVQIILCNTYHLYLRPGEKIIKKLGGLHKFIGWDKPILTDSGGYQVFSLGQKKNYQLPITNFQSIANNVIPTNVEGSFKKISPPPPKAGSRNDNNNSGSLVKITDKGVEFKSHLDGSKHLLTPEKVIQIQLDLGVDILMPLDVCPSGKATKEEVKKACDITLRWAGRSKTYFDRKIQETSNPDAEAGAGKKQTIRQLADKLTNQQINKQPLLHGIVQGGLYEDLRREHAKEMIKLDFDGYSIGGLAVDHETRDMWKTVKLMGEILPENKQRYLMGVGTPDDIIKATKLGMDMFDCVLPTRLARHGSVYAKIKKSKIKMKNLGEHSVLGTKYILINLLNSKYREDGEVIEKDCGCYACKNGYSKAYISHLIRSNEMFGLRLATLHNLWVYIKLAKSLRDLKK